MWFDDDNPSHRYPTHPSLRGGVAPSRHQVQMAAWHARRRERLALERRAERDRVLAVPGRVAALALLAKGGVAVLRAVARAGRRGRV